MERDFNNFMPPFMDYGMPPNSPQDDMFNPMMQYEQAYWIKHLLFLFFFFTPNI